MWSIIYLYGKNRKILACFGPFKTKKIAKHHLECMELGRADDYFKIIKMIPL